MPALLSPALARLPLAEARQTTPDDQPILPPGADSPGFLPPQPPLNLDSQILGHQHILPEAADSSPFAFPTHFEGSALSPEVGSGHLPLLQEEDVQEQEDQFSSDDAPSYGQTSPQNSHQISGHLSSQIPDHMLRHMAGYMSRRASGCLSDESCGHLHSRPESADEELLGIIKHAQMSMAAAVEAAAAAAAAINSHAAANREHQLPSSCHSGEYAFPSALMTCQQGRAIALLPLIQFACALAHLSRTVQTCGDGMGCATEFPPLALARCQRTAQPSCL